METLPTSSLAEHLNNIFGWPPSVPPQKLFPADLVNFAVNLISSELAACVVEGTKDDGKTGAVSEDGGHCADYSSILSVSCLGSGVWG